MFCLIGFGIVLVLSLVLGTSSFNKYCAQAQAGDWGGALSVYGKERSGFLGCELNTLTLNFPVLLLGIFILQYLAQIYLIVILKRRRLLVHVWIMAVMIFLLISLIYLSTSIFPYLAINPLEGQVRLEHGSLSAVEILNAPSIYRLLDLGVLLNYLMQMFFVFTLLFAGPLVAIWSLNKFEKKLKLKPGIKMYIYTLLSSACIHVFIIGILLQTLVFWNFRHNRPQVEIREMPLAPSVFEATIPTFKPQFVEITLPPIEE